MKILLVEDDIPSASVLSEVITAQHYTVDVASDGEMGLYMATSWEYDLVLLDLLIPKLDGISLCRQLRHHGFQKPILLLTAKDSSSDIVRGLDAGADDYVTKPYDLSELLARMRALLRRGQASLAPTLLTWEQLCVNPVSAEVTYQEQVLSLSPKEYGLLGLFLRNPQRIFSRSDIIDRLWSIDASPSEGAVTNLIKDLRQKLKAAGMKTDLLETVYGLGYRLKPPPTQSATSAHSKPGAKDSSKSKASTASATEPVATQKPALQPKDLTSIYKVLERYQHTFAARVVTLEDIQPWLQAGTLSQPQQQTAAQEAHRLAGALGSFGYEAGSRLARSIEQLLIQDARLAPAQIAQFTELITQLKHELAKPPTPLVDRLPSPPDASTVLVVDADTTFTHPLQQAALAWGLQVDVATNFTIAKQKMSDALPEAVLLSLSDLAQDASLLQELAEQFSTVPVLVVTGEDRLTDRVVVSRFSIKRFLHKPISPTEVLEAIVQVLPQPQMPAAKVMILDDDPIILEALRDLLQPWGLHVTTLPDPQQFWTVLTATQPDLLVLDLEMPTFNGIDLCRVVRQDPKWGNLPILVVTAHTQMESIQHVFAAGADDFIGKPVVGPELVTRVISRIDRSRLQRELETMKRRVGT
ncbi:response regulator [Thermocoleostomius sinensis]|uniref:Response regulator n=1 Tax=Thermocoleostomius sinensis A174 TaxID=2016057 RepID=A0A9E9C9T7_9CYAN|nr:response regulator [Thermocoleostomius sinensis]WAL61998.1 response regulator [Thermocoleostomius sinensis A174]